MPIDVPPTWLPLAELASAEEDPEKLLKLIGDLCDAIDATRAQNHSHSTATFRTKIENCPPA